MTVKFTPFRYFPLPPFRQACRTRASRRTRHYPRIYINARVVPRVLSASHLDRVRQGEVRRHGRECGGCAKWRSGHQRGRWIVANPMHSSYALGTPWKLLRLRLARLAGGRLARTNVGLLAECTTSTHFYLPLLSSCGKTMARIIPNPPQKRKWHGRRTQGFSIKREYAPHRTDSRPHHGPVGPTDRANGRRCAPSMSAFGLDPGPARSRRHRHTSVYQT